MDSTFHKFAAELRLALPLRPVCEAWRPFEAKAGPVTILSHGKKLELGAVDPLEAVRTAARYLDVFRVCVGEEEIYVHNHRPILGKWHLPDVLK
jgi:hypothetical protein